MRIVQVAASIAESDGGPTTGVLGLNRALNRRHDTSSVALTTDADGYSGRLSPAETARLEQKMNGAIVFRRSRPFRLKHSWGLMRATFQQARTADLVYIHGVYLAHSLWAWLAARRWKRPYVVQPHGALEPYQAQFGRVQKAIWDALVGQRILRGAKALIAASDDEAHNLRGLQPGAQIVVIPLGASEGEAHVSSPIRTSVESWLDVPRHERVLFLGRLAKKKRPDLLMDAWNTTTVGRLAVVGPDGEWTADELAGRLDTSRRPTVTFPGPVDPAGVRWFMRHAGVFVLPSENENFGIAVAEAMAGGAAVLTTKQTAASVHVARAEAGVVLDSPSRDELAQALQALVTSPDRVADAGARGERYAAIHLSWDAAANALLQALTPQDTIVLPSSHDRLGIDRQ